jgi:hypothetical protein
MISLSIIMPLSIMTQSIMDNDIKHNNIKHNDVKHNATRDNYKNIFTIKKDSSKGHNLDYYTRCHQAECPKAECCGAQKIK